jgi:predicted HicB family RNase H-like nuclease
MSDRGPTKFLTMRVPWDLYEAARDAAERDGRSLSNWIQKAMRDRVGAQGQEAEEATP